MGWHCYSNTKTSKLNGTLNSDQSTRIVGSHMETNNKGVEWDSIDIRVTHWLGEDSKRIQLELQASVLLYIYYSSLGLSTNRI